jgi:transposase
MEDHERVVEDIIPAKVMVKCYHTRSGYCPCCRKRVESRALEQPPAANIPHGQLGINALATAMVLRIVYRLPFRQISGVFAQLPQLSVSPGAVARQVQRVAEWFDQDYQKLLLQMRCAPIVYADETGWRVAGRNGQLWTITSPDKNHRRQPKQKRREGLGHIGFIDEDRDSAKPKVVRYGSLDAGRCLGNSKTADDAERTVVGK